jgi:hypothetical protein
MIDLFLFPILSFYALYIVITSSNEKTEYKPMYNYHHYGIARYKMSKWYSLDLMRKLRSKYK